MDLVANNVANYTDNYTGSEVRVMNLTYERRTRLGIKIKDSKDQLVFTNVPDAGATSLLLGIGLIGLVGMNRRLKISKAPS